MSNSDGPQPSPRAGRDRYLQALMAARELEKLGFHFSALRREQIDELSTKFGLTPEERYQFVIALIVRFGISRGS